MMTEDARSYLHECSFTGRYLSFTGRHRACYFLTTHYSTLDCVNVYTYTIYCLTRMHHNNSLDGWIMLQGKNMDTHPTNRKTTPNAIQWFSYKMASNTFQFQRLLSRDVNGHKQIKWNAII